VSIPDTSSGSDETITTWPSGSGLPVSWLLDAGTIARRRQGGSGAAVAGQFYPAQPAGVEAGARRVRAGRGGRPKPDRPIANRRAARRLHLLRPRSPPTRGARAGRHRYDTIVLLGTNIRPSRTGRVSVYCGARPSARRCGHGPDRQGDHRRSPQGGLDLGAPTSGRPTPASTRLKCTCHSSSTCFPRAKIVAAVVGTQDPASCARFAARSTILKDRQVLSSRQHLDLSHYRPRATRRAWTGGRSEAIASLSPDRLHSSAQQRCSEASPDLDDRLRRGADHAGDDGRDAARRTRGTVVSYANSADVAVAIPRARLGYGAVVFTAGERGSDTSALTGRRPEKRPPDGRRQEGAAQRRGRPCSGTLNTETLPLARA